MDIRNTITRFGATALIGCGLVVTAIPATFAQNGEETVTHEYQDRAASHISEVWYKGETLKISGEGFLTQDRASGSTIAIKLNKGAVKIDGKDYLEVTANDKGEFTVSIPWQNDLEDRVSVDVYLLSGSLKDNDTSRGGKAATVKIEARSVAPESPSASASAEPSVSVSASASATAEPKKDSAEEPKADASASPSASATAADETVASVDAQVKNRALRLPHRLRLLPLFLLLLPLRRRRKTRRRLVTRRTVPSRLPLRRISWAVLRTFRLRQPSSLRLRALALRTALRLPPPAWLLFRRATRTSVRSLTLMITASVARLLTTVPLRMEAPPRTVALLRRMVLTRVHRVARIVLILLRRTPLFRAVRSVPRWLTPVLRTCLPCPVWAW